jgi:hypothetical protein
LNVLWLQKVLPQSSINHGPWYTHPATSAAVLPPGPSPAMSSDLNVVALCFLCGAPWCRCPVTIRQPTLRKTFSVSANTCRRVTPRLSVN